MNWGKIIIAGIAGGIVMNVVEFGMHVGLMGPTYTEYTTVFSQEPANPLWHVAIALLTGLVVAAFFAKTRSSWAAGWKGGAAFGAFFGLATFFTNFIYPMVIADFPYFLAWCWGSMDLFARTVLGAVVGAIYKG